MEIYAFDMHDGYLCRDCVIKRKHLTEERMQAVEDGSDLTFIDDNGYSFGLLHEGTSQYEPFPGFLLDPNGIYCASCEDELLAPMFD